MFRLRGVNRSIATIGAGGSGGVVRSVVRAAVGSGSRVCRRVMSTAGSVTSVVPAVTEPLLAMPFRVDEELLTGLYRNKSLLVWDNRPPAAAAAAAPATPEPAGMQTIPPSATTNTNAATAAAAARTGQFSDDPDVLPDMNPLNSTTLPADAIAAAAAAAAGAAASAESGAMPPRVYVLGTHHALIDSALHVRDVIRTVKPDVVIIESCRERIQRSDDAAPADAAAAAAASEDAGWRTDPVTGTDQLTRRVTFDTDAYLANPHNTYRCDDASHNHPTAEAQHAGTVDWRPASILTGSDVLAVVRAHAWSDPARALKVIARYYTQYLDDLLDVVTGVEQTIAAREAQAIGATVVLGDQPASTTIRDVVRAYGTDIRLALNTHTRAAMIEHSYQRTRAEERQRIYDQHGVGASIAQRARDAAAGGNTAAVTAGTGMDGGSGSGVWAPNPFVEMKAHAHFKNVLDTVYNNSTPPTAGVKQWAIDHWTTVQRREFWRTKQRADALGTGTVQHWSELLDERIDPHKPAFHRALIENRDRYITNVIRKFPGKTVVAVVSQRHVFGMQREWAAPQSFDATYTARVLQMLSGSRAARESAKSDPVWKYLIAPKWFSPRWYIAHKFAIIVGVCFLLFAWTTAHQHTTFGTETAARHDRKQAPFYIQGTIFFLAGAGIVAAVGLVSAPFAIRNSLTRFDRARKLWRDVKLSK